MHPVYTPGYSDFFASGFHVVSRPTVLDSLSKRAFLPKPIPLSFDSALSDTDSEDEPSKRRSRRSSIFNPLSKAKSAFASENLQSSSRTSKPKKHQRSASLISNLFGRRQSRQTTAAATRVMSNDESGWLSSASSVSSIDDDIDFMDLSTWPECPRGRSECSPQATTELYSEPEVLDPFSSSPSSKSFFVDVNLPTNTSAEEAISTRRSRPVSMSSWSNRFSFSSTSSASSSSFFSSSRRNSLSIRPTSFLSTGTSSSRSPPADTSFLHLPRVPRTNKRNSAERKRPASIHVMSTTSASSPHASMFATATTTKIAPPIKHERRHTQIDILPTSRAQPPRTESHTRSRSLQLSQLPTTRSSRVRSLFLSPKSPSISAPIPEGKCDSGIWTAHNETGNHNGIYGAPNGMPSFNFISIPSPMSQVPDRVSEADDESDDIVVEREHDSDEGLQDSVVVGPDEEEAPSSALDARVFFGSEMEDDVPKRVDWREFCIEVLDGHSDA